MEKKDDLFEEGKEDRSWSRREIADAFAKVAKECGQDGRAVKIKVLEILMKKKKDRLEEEDVLKIALKISVPGDVTKWRDAVVSVLFDRK